jgi:DNA polymerase-1
MSDGKPKLLVIDGNNMSHRMYWAHKELSYNGRCTGLLYGFFRGLIALHKDYPDYFRVIVWDRGYNRRLEESTRAVQDGIVPEAYKQNRRDKAEEAAEDPEAARVREEISEQMDEVKEALNFVRCLQVGIDGTEGDDVAFSYAKQNQANGGDTVIVSSDKDFMQVLDDRICVYDAMKQEKWTKERFKVEFEFDPALWVDVGALEGEEGPTKDNIFGVPGWGPVTACKYVREWGTLEQIIAVLENKVKAGSKLAKKEQVLLAHVPRAMLAKSLKRMDNIPNLPKPRVMRKYDVKEVEQYFLTFRFASLLKEAWRLV